MLKYGIDHGLISEKSLMLHAVLLLRLGLRGYVVQSDPKVTDPRLHYYFLNVI
jgi:hypothetical protein